MTSAAPGQVTAPESLILDGLPPVPAALKQEVGRYLEFRSASLGDWHPTRREMVIATRFADTMQLHRVTMPMGARRQLTFGNEPIMGGTFEPKTGGYLVYPQDAGGGEFYQLYRYDLADGRSTLLTDGKSRNGGARWARSGKWVAYTSTRRNGKDNDIYRVNPADPKTDKLLLEVTGGGWGILDWSPDESQLLLAEYISINKSHLHLLDLKTGQRRQLTPDQGESVAYAGARFARGGRSIFATCDLDSEFQRLVEFELPSGTARLGKPRRVLTGAIPWDIESFDLSDDGRRLAFVANENGVGALHLMDPANGKELKVPKLPMGQVSGVTWHSNNRDLGFNITSARSPADVYSLDTKDGRLERWTESETGGLNTRQFVEPELVKIKSFDGLPVSGFLYKPDAKKFPGKRPVLINIHGGPEGQSRPGFLGRNNYYLNEMGVAILFPNVRGSSGYGKTFLTLDNGFKREDSVKDIGAFIQWLKTQPEIDPDRIGVIGGSYGGYMVLACMIHFGDQLRCGIDIVGISNFLTFLKNTQDYRRDLRRVEYGDERDPAMAEFMARIAPTAHARKITKPLFVVQGQNDPRVPVTEAEQMVKAIRDAGGKAWYLCAKDEGHGFAKKRNVDFLALATALFLQENLVR